jgi:F-box/leucine-rich repeat protein 7
MFRNFQIGFLHTLAMSLKPIQYTKGKFIIRQGEIAGEMYFVARGTADIINEETGGSYGSLQSGSFFGEIGILLQTVRTASVICSSDVINVFRLSKKDLDGVLLRFPEVSENIKEEANRRIKNETENTKLASFASTSSLVNIDIDVTRERLKHV